MTVKYHMSINIEGVLRNCKGRRIDFFEDDNGNPISDAQARKEIAEAQAKGHKLMCCSPNDCEGFDPFGGGCPGHSVEQIKTESNE